MFFHLNYEQLVAAEGLAWYKVLCSSCEHTRCSAELVSKELKKEIAKRKIAQDNFEYLEVVG